MNRTQWKRLRRSQRDRKAIRNRRLSPAVAMLEGRTLLSTFSVNNTADSGNGSLRWAIQQADRNSQADTIVFDKNVFSRPQTITLTSGELTLGDTQKTTITGPGSGLLTITGNSASRVFYLEYGSVAISGLTISGGSDTYGGGMLLEQGSADLTDCVLSDNVAGERGGALYDRLASLTMTSCTISGNTATYDNGGGIYVDDGALTMTDCSIRDNTTKQGNGGGLYVLQDKATLTDCTISGNSASNRGGGVHVGAAPGAGSLGGGEVDLTGCSVTDNTASDGGGVMNDGGTLSLSDCVVSGNSADANRGGGLYGRYGSTSVKNSSVTGNSANQGGGLDLTNSSGTKTYVSDSTISGNSAHDGAGVDVGGGTVKLTDCTVSGNTASHNGGGLRNGAAALYLVDSTVSDNTAYSNGGGVYTEGLSYLLSTTVSQNSAYRGGGVFLNGDSARATLFDTIVANQQSGGDVDGTLYYTSASNLIGDGSGGMTNGTNHNLVGSSSHPIDPKLGPLGNYGGPTPTMPLLSGSPAINAGSTNHGTVGTSIPSTDQRGFSRVGTTDIGAFEYQGPSLVVNTTADGLVSSPGTMTLRQAVNLANAQSTADTITFDSSVFGSTPRTITLTDGDLTLSDPAKTTIQGSGARLLTISGNNASRVFEVAPGAQADISGLTIANGSAYDGGGVENLNGTLTLRESAVLDNQASDEGGGIYNIGGTLTLENSTLSGNTSRLSGGGVRSYYGSLSLTNVTVSGNSGKNGSVSGHYSSLSLVNVTVSGNSGGGVDHLGGSVQMNNTIVAGQSSGADVSGSYSGANNLIGGDPLLAALGNYGGPTQTMALLPGSPAIDAGASGSGVFSTDQRGLKRVGAVDIGAFESQGFMLSPVSGSTPQSTQAGSAFGQPLAVQVKPVHAGDPVDGGVVNFSVNPANGASATLSAASAVISGGQAGVTATANGTMGHYTVTASAVESSPATFNLSNTEAPSLVVTTTSDVVNDTDGLTSLREAIAYANSHPGADTITFDTSVFGSTPQTITLTGGDLTLSDSKETTISGPGAGLLTISGNKASRVFEVAPGAQAVISGLTIADGYASDGGGVENLNGTLTLRESAVLDNQASDEGGGIYNNGGTLILKDSTLSGNTSQLTGGGVRSYYGSLSLTNVTVSGNSGKNGSVSGHYSSLSLVNVTVSGNSGGGVDHLGGSLLMINTIVAGQSSGADVSGSYSGANNLIGGDAMLAALGNYGGPTPTMALLPGSPAIDAGQSASGIPSTDQRGFARVGAPDIGAFESQGGSLVVNTTADGIVSDPGVLTLREAVNLANTLPSADTITFDPTVFNFDNNDRILLTGQELKLTDPAQTTILGPESGNLRVSGDGLSRVFEVAAGASASFVGFEIQSGSADKGGDVYNSGTLSLSYVLLGSSSVSSNGGDVYNSGTLTVSDSTFNGGSATNGGNLYLDKGTATITDSTFRDGYVYGNGGDVYLHGGSLSLVDTTVLGGYAYFGAGVYVEGGTLSLSNVTESGNTAWDTGGGLYVSGGSVSLTNVTVSGNKGLKSTGGLYVSGGSVSLTNTIVAAQTTGGDVSGSVDSSSSYNLIGDGSGGLTNGTNHNLVGSSTNPIDPMLASLGYYGGRTQTLPLLAGSPAIDAGTSTDAPSTDQRGMGRVGAPDLGAFEYQGPSLVVNTTADGTLSAQGEFTLRQAVDLANTLSSADTITFDPAVFGSTPQTITLYGEDIRLTDPAQTTIQGPGANLLTIDAHGYGRSFSVAGLAAISGLTITGGKQGESYEGPSSYYQGGGVLVDHGTLTLSDCTITGNSARISGGGVFNDHGTLTLTDSAIRDNSTSKYGGGVFNDGGTLSMTGCTVSGNSTGYYGGGVSSKGGTLTLTDCTVSGNTASNPRGISLGGGLYITSSTQATLTNTTISGNSAIAGGGILSTDGSTLTLINVTESGNKAHYGGGLEIYKSGTISATNSIFADPLDTTDIDATLDSSSSNNLIGDGSGGLTNGVNGNLVGSPTNPIDPLLAPLGDYGGPTPTMPLLPGSPAINAGTSGSKVLNTDERGQSRVGAVDIGAFESQGFVLSAVSGSTPQSTTVGTDFANSLTVTVVAKNAVEPVNGGIVNFSVVPVQGASAILSATSVTISDGQAGVTAAANDSVGTYWVSAQAAGASSANFALTNEALPLQLTQLAVGFGNTSYVVNPGNTKALPWTDIRTLKLTFNGDASGLTLADFSLTGSRFGNYLAGASLSYDAASQTVTISLAAAAVIGSDGWASKVGKSGDRLTFGFGGSTQTFNVLPGDHDGNGVVNLLDMLAVRGAEQTGQPYDIFADLNGDGVVDATDFALARKWAGSVLR